jgi:hypothetical protein
MSSRDIDLLASVAAFARIVYTDLTTVVLVSVLTTLTMIPIITIGAGLFACCETLTAVITGEGRGGPTTERARFRLYREAFQRHLVHGLPYSALIVAVFVTVYAYVRLAYTLQSGVFLLGSLLGLYVLVLTLIWTLRASSIVIRTENTPGFINAMREGSYVALAEPPYSALHIVTAGLLIGLTAAFGIAVPLLLPGLLAVLEVVVFEDLTGEGAEDVLARYRGETT